jgi:hypothetical protein
VGSRLTTIVSDARAGAGRGALEAALELDMDRGGWAARGIGVPEAYRDRLRRAPSPQLAARLNVQDSDGTLIISFGTEISDGTPAAFADEAVQLQRKPSLHVVLPAGGRSTIPDEVRREVLSWIAEERIAVLHVTGSGEAEEPGVQQAVHHALVWIFEDDLDMDSKRRARVEGFAAEVIGPMIGSTFEAPAVSVMPAETPAGRFQFVLDLAKEGRISQEQARALLEMPALSFEERIAALPVAGADVDLDEASQLLAMPGLSPEQRERVIEWAQAGVISTQPDPDLASCPRCGPVLLPHICAPDDGD